MRRIAIIVTTKIEPLEVTGMTEALESSSQVLWQKSFRSEGIRQITAVGGRAKDTNEIETDDPNTRTVVSLGLDYGKNTTTKRADVLRQAYPLVNFDLPDPVEDNIDAWIQPFAEGVRVAEQILSTPSWINREPENDGLCQQADEEIQRSDFEKTVSQVKGWWTALVNYSERVYGKMLSHNSESDPETCEYGEVWRRYQYHRGNNTSELKCWLSRMASIKLVSTSKVLLRQRYHFHDRRRPETALLDLQAARIEQFCDHPSTIGFVWRLVSFYEGGACETDNETSPFAKARRFAERCSGIKVRLDDFDDVPACLIQTPDEKVAFLYSGLSEAEQTWSLCHETAHILLQHNPMFFLDRHSLSDDEKAIHDNQEAEAEALACLLSVMFGVKQITPLQPADGESNSSNAAQAGSSDNRFIRHKAERQHSHFSRGTPADEKTCVRQQGDQPQPELKAEEMTCGE